ncbi:hypothetical protein Y032_0295g1655 [Ancylostoma ceylanicum]|uniref:Nanos-type domain-containing protein n=2 Tax=Ancylostoma ceylanicum TaxID=53326 RepID=A0A016S5V0_9BILA|nr:hypothetical protein Y032_0295g1655 [Ancylostoma ceylanicum]
MSSKVELELKRRPDNRRTTTDTNGMRGGKIELELKKPHRERGVNLIFTDSWQQYSECNGLPTARRNEDGKEMLRAESMLSDFLNGSDHTIYEVDGESDADVSGIRHHNCTINIFTSIWSPPHDPSHGCSLSPALTPSPQAPPCSSPKQHRYCWYCYETYKAMCLAQGKTPPGVYSRGLWRGHCMRDSNGVTTCPHLWFTTCTHCGATADSAHSPKFCPMLQLAGLNIHDQ